LDANQNVRADAALTVGSLNESITIRADAPPVDSRSAVMGTLIDDRRLTELPTNGRNVISLAALLPERLGRQRAADLDQGLIRVDHNLGNKHLLTGRYNHSYASEISIAGQVPTYETIFNWARVQTATAADTYTVMPAMVNEFRLSYNRFSPEYQGEHQKVGGLRPKCLIPWYDASIQATVAPKNALGF
jgi:hypothetical protein